MGPGDICKNCSFFVRNYASRGQVRWASWLFSAQHTLRLNFSLYFVFFPAIRRGRAIFECKGNSSSRQKCRAALYRIQRHMQGSWIEPLRAKSRCANNTDRPRTRYLVLLLSLSCPGACVRALASPACCILLLPAIALHGSNIHSELAAPFHCVILPCRLHHQSQKMPSFRLYENTVHCLHFLECNKQNNGPKLSQSRVKFSLRYISFFYSRSKITFILLWLLRVPKSGFGCLLKERSENKRTNLQNLDIFKSLTNPLQLFWRKFANFINFFLLLGFHLFCVIVSDANSAYSGWVIPHKGIYDWQWTLYFSVV